MAVGVQKAWSTTAASNGTADTNVNFAEGQLMPTLNNSSRALMAAVRGWANQIQGGCTSGGSSNAYTITSDSVAAISSAYAAGMMFMLKANHTNSGAATLNVDGVGAVAIKTSDGGDVVAGDIVANGLYLLAYNSTGPRFDLIGTFAGGSFQPLDATLTAMAGASSSTTNAFFRATDVDAFTFESASSFRTALGLGNLATVTPGTGVATALAVNVGSSGAFVVNGGALGTPSSGTLSSCTGLPVSTGISGLGTNVATALAIAIGSAGAVITSNSTDTLSNKTLSSPTISGTVAGDFTMSGNPVISNTAPNLRLYESDAASDKKYWRFLASGGELLIGGTDDAISTGFTAIQVQRTGTTVDAINFYGTLVAVIGALQARVATSSETSGTLTSASANKHLALTGNITLNNSVFTANDKMTLDPGTSARTITRGSGCTMYVNGTDSATATLAANQMGGVHVRSASVFVLTGAVS